MSTVPYFRSQKYSALRLKVQNIVTLESRWRQCKAEVAPSKCVRVARRNKNNNNSVPF